MSPDTRQHRGAHPADGKLFSEADLPRLRVAVAELSWLLTRRYSANAALKLVGDKHSLADRQRLAVSRAACSDQSLAQRESSRQSFAHLFGEDIIIDGFNLIITIEAALSGGVLLLCRDECIRDLSSVHGSYRAVSETEKAIILIGKALEQLKVRSTEWVLDRPVSNSGRLARRIQELAQEREWNWTVELLFNPDAQIASSQKTAVTSDSVVLDKVARWINVKAWLVEQMGPRANTIDLRSSFH